MKTTMMALLSAAALCAGAGAATFEDQPAVNPPCGKGIGFNILRGAASVLCSPVEIVRMTVFYNTKYPVIGTLPGVLVGPLATLKRAGLGLTDICGFGLAGDSLYSSLSTPDFVWEDEWVYAESAVPASSPPVKPDHQSSRNL